YLLYGLGSARVGELVDPADAQRVRVRAIGGIEDHVPDRLSVARSAIEREGSGVVGIFDRALDEEGATAFRACGEGGEESCEHEGSSHGKGSSCAGRRIGLRRFGVCETSVPARESVTARAARGSMHDERGLVGGGGQAERRAGETQAGDGVAVSGTHVGYVE